MAVQRRYSHQRELIYNYLCSTCEHPSAEVIYQALKPTNPELSLGTVYRNLKLLEELGKVKKVAHVDDTDRYDACCHDHAHLVCTQCGSVVDANVDFDALKGVIDTNAFLLTSVSVTLHGVCDKCKNK